MDIEHWEYESLIGLKEETLNQFKFIAIEYHFKDQTKFKSNNFYYNVLKKLEKLIKLFTLDVMEIEDILYNLGLIGYVIL